MRKKINAFAVILCCTIVACKKDSGTDGNIIIPNGATGSSQPGGGTMAARGTTDDYSQSIPVDTANRMIGSYLTSIGYPAVDTSLRALSFDAGVLRDYLSDPAIVTVKFTLAHQQTYMNNGKFGRAAGMNPQAITLVIAGLNGSGIAVRNSSNGVYDHMVPCPSQCDGAANGLIQ